MGWLSVGCLDKCNIGFYRVKICVMIKGCERTRERDRKGGREREREIERERER